MIHYSLKNINESNVFKDLCYFQNNIQKSNFATYQNNLIPVYNSKDIDLKNIDLKNTDLQSIDLQKDIYEQFYNNTGAIIIKNVYSKYIMDSYNKWSEKQLLSSMNDPNCRHHKQKDKYLINDVIGHMSENNPNLLLELLNNQYFHFFIDVLLGFSRIGSCTGHWIEPGGNRQMSHVDYPMHAGSKGFWNKDFEKIKKLTTHHQLNQMLPYFSVQVLIASDKMNKSNGSTELVPTSHKIQNLDLHIHNKQIYNEFENKFINVELEQGDMLIFNRRLCHRGGKNISDKRRNSLIIQCVWLWGIGQEIIESSKVFKNLEKSSIYENMSEQDKDSFKLRLQAPYPIDVKKSA